MKRNHLCILISSLISFLILAAFVDNPQTIQLDTYLFILINQRLALEWLDPLFEFGAILLVFIPLIPAAGLFFIGDSNTKKTIILLATVIIFSDLLKDVIKELIGRLRPQDALEEVRLVIGSEDGRSFPSGHTTVATVITTFVIYFSEKRAKLLMILYLLTVGYSRIYVGVHYPLDVVGGMLLGVSTSLGLVALYETVSSKTDFSLKKE